MRQAPFRRSQTLSPKSKGLRTPIYPTPSSPLSRLQPYVLPSPCARTQPLFAAVVAAHASIRDAARIALSEQAVSKLISSPTDGDMTLNHSCLLLRQYDHSCAALNMSLPLKRGIVSPHPHPLHNQRQGCIDCAARSMDDVDPTSSHQEG